MMQDKSQPDADRQWLLHGDLPCLGCQYNLRGLVGPVVKCPECGHANDLRNPAPWRKKKLPTGIREREHWPACAALASLLVMVILPLAVVSVFEIVNSLPQLAMPLVALVPLPIFAVVLAWWAWLCLRWLRSCQNRVWGWGVLAGAHLSMWGILLGVTVPVGSQMQLPGVMVGLALPIAVVGFFYLRAVIRKADQAGQFRIDWRKWQVPTGEQVAAAEAER